MANYLSKVQMDNGVVAEIRDKNAHTLISNLTTTVSGATKNIESLQKSTKEMLLNINDFGAVGDGVTDDYNAFASAMAYAESVGGCTIVLTDKYFIGSTLTVPINTTLVGRSKFYASDIKLGEDTGWLDDIPQILHSGTTTINLLNGASVEGFAIINSGVTYNRHIAPLDTALSGHGIQCVGRTSGGNSFLNMAIVGFNKGIFYQTSRGLIKDCIIDCNWGVEITQCYDCVYLSNVHCWPLGGGFESPIEVESFRSGAGIYLHDGADQVRMTDCFVISHDMGYAFAHVNSPFMSNCSADRCNLGVNIVRAEQGIITNFLSINTKKGFMLKDGNVSISNVEIINATICAFDVCSTGEYNAKSAFNILGFNVSKSNCGFLFRPTGYPLITIGTGTFESCSMCYSYSTAFKKVSISNVAYRECDLVEHTPVNHDMAIIESASTLNIGVDIFSENCIIVTGTNTIEDISYKGVTNSELTLLINNGLTIKNNSNIKIPNGDLVCASESVVTFINRQGVWYLKSYSGS